MTRHRGPCVNYDGQDPKDYDEYDSCSKHLAAARRRRGLIWLGLTILAILAARGVESIIHDGLAYPWW